MPTIITIADQVRYVEQELAMYRSAFPSMIASGKITKELADWRLECAGRVLASLRTLLPPTPAMADALPVVCYFATEADRQSFIDTWKQSATIQTKGARP